MTLQQKLSQIQKDLKVPKSHHNNFGNYDYRNAEDILDAVKPLLGDVVLTISDNIELIGTRYYVRAIVTLNLGEEKISACAFARESDTKKGMDESQITGAASSYARKYALNGLFAIDDTKDSDHQENKNEIKKNNSDKNKDDTEEKKNLLYAIKSEKAKTKYKLNATELEIVRNPQKHTIDEIKKIFDAASTYQETAKQKDEVPFDTTQLTEEEKKEQKELDDRFFDEEIDDEIEVN